MLEILATPNWKQERTTLEDWAEAFRSQGLMVTLDRESSSVTWLEIASIRLRGYVLSDGLRVEAIDFELSSVDIEPARTALETAAAALAWELDDEPLDDDDD